MTSITATIVPEEGVVRRTCSFRNGNETLVGDLVLPDRSGPHPAILAIAGTGAQNRYGDIVLPDGTVLPHSRYRWISKRLAQAGIASFYWDKRGVGESTGGEHAPGDPPGERDIPVHMKVDTFGTSKFARSKPEKQPAHQRKIKRELSKSRG